MLCVLPVISSFTSKIKKEQQKISEHSMCANSIIFARFFYQCIISERMQQYSLCTVYSNYNMLLFLLFTDFWATSIAFLVVFGWLRYSDHA